VKVFLDSPLEGVDVCRFGQVLRKWLLSWNGAGPRHGLSVVAGTARATTIVVEGSTIVGFPYGIIFVAYAVIPEPLPNKYGYV
jgi:hypothetical protein